MAVVLNRGGVKKFLGGHKPVHALQHRKNFEQECALPKVIICANFTPLHVIWFSSGRDGSRVKYLEILQAEFESACKHSGAQLVGMPSPFNNKICALVAFDRAPRSVCCRFGFL